jgi:diguanylate cyclase (GGDEF)-like protein
MRDETAGARSETAGQRDRSGEPRDQAADEGGRLDQGQTESDAHESGENVLLRAEHDREIAATDRARAADDRAKAAADRDEATREREEAFLAKAEAQHDLLLAATDELTGAFTRKCGLENITREIERARRTEDSLTLAFLDVDGLKEVNDTSGHSDGDRLLRRVVDTVRANVRAYDVIVRYGGDEFLCVLPQLPRNIAQDRMEKIAAVLTAADAQHSIAFGLAEYDPADGIDELIGRADTELLEAKRRHKGRS